MPYERDFLSLYDSNDMIDSIFMAIAWYFDSILYIDLEHDVFYAPIYTEKISRYCNNKGKYSELVSALTRNMVFQDDCEYCNMMLSPVNIRKNASMGIHEFDYRCLMSNGEYRWVRNKFFVHKTDKNGMPVLIVMFTFDVHEEKIKNIKREYERFYFNMLAEMNKSIITTYNMHTKIAESFKIISMHSNQQNILSKKWNDIHNEWKKYIHPDYYEKFFQFFLNESNTENDITILCKPVFDDGSEFQWYRVRVKFLKYNDGVLHRIVTTFEDIDKEKREVLVAHEKLKWDAFTELYNKQSFEAEIFRLLAKNNGGTDILILFDLDHFKDVNDTYGHREGDRIIRESAGILKNSFRGGDLIGRIGGDEFGVFCRNCSDPKLISERVRHVCEQISRLIPSEEKGISCSAGITFGMRGKTFEKMYAEADEALYRQKRRGRNGYAFYEENCARA